MSDLDDILAARAEALAIPPGDVDHVIGRARVRRRTRRAVGSSALAVAVVAGGAVVLSNRGGDSDGTPLGVGGPFRIVRGSPMLRWDRVTPRAALGMSRRIHDGSAFYAVSTGAATSKNEDAPRIAYTSTDGIDWTPLAAAPDMITELTSDGTALIGVGTAPAFAASSDVNAPAPPDVLTTSWSTDGGKTFQRDALPFSLPSRAGVSSAFRGVQVASTPAGTVVMAALDGSVDAAALVPAGTSLANGWEQTVDGIDVLGAPAACPAGTKPFETVGAAKAEIAARDGSATPNKGGDPATARLPAPPSAVLPPDAKTAPDVVPAPSAPGPDPGPSRAGKAARGMGRIPAACVSPDGTIAVADQPVVAHLTWDQLGLTGDALAAVRHEAVAFFAAHGSRTFARVTLPAGVRADDILLDSADDGFTAVVGAYDTKDATTTVLSSADGRAWSAAPGPAVFGGWYAGAMGRVGDVDAILGNGPAGPALGVRGQGATSWTTIPLTDVIGQGVADVSRLGLVAAGIGGMGAVAVVSVTEDPIAKAGGASIKSGDWTLRVLNESLALELVDPAGTVVGRGQLGQLGPDGVLRQGSDGSVLAVRDGVEAARFTGQQVKEVFAGAEPGRTTYRLLSSIDGRTWADEPIEALLGTDRSAVSRVLVSGQRAVVTAQLPGTPEGAAPSTQLALVGSRR
jgi:hypothetical protein